MILKRFVFEAADYCFLKIIYLNIIKHLFSGKKWLDKIYTQSFFTKKKKRL